MKKGKIFVGIVSSIIIIMSFINSRGELVENLELPVGLGADIDRSSGQLQYSVPLLTYSIGGSEELTKKILVGKGATLGQTRESRQLQSDKKLTLGVMRVYAFSEETARYGLREWIDINFNNAFFNDRVICIVCKGTAEELFNFDIPGYKSSVEYIENMVKNLKEYNFFKMQYSLNDLIVRVDAEGRNALLPYIETCGDKVKVTGLAIFKDDKMIGKADIRETRMINMLKENNVKGVLTLQKSADEYVNMMANTNRKIKCTKEGGKYKFIINLNIKGEIMSNEVYKKMYEKEKNIKLFEKDMKALIEKQSNDLINDIKSKYQADILDLGRVAASKYGRDNGNDWDKIVTQSEVVVNVKVKLTGLGRGDY
ncbi:Ger(x)C family spore germination protein [Clostridium sp. YIM B02505]|uniref:Ger(X)C family spore germination protein n=1 Tax=Clostridium yunnanense TaxID=2800325 RepID=A0ABS1EPZ1_9CLOT|nr:Ger(x)C family spore germination protein [Clostridium yunnanense]MBK1811486.1 Ger(x)C family spore germination protein [Clostridium yunnanense]